MARQLRLRPLALAVAVYVAGAYSASVNIEELFGPYMSPGTEIASSSDANFSTVVTPRWSSWESPTWIGAIKPETEADLQKIVQIASSNNISFLATTGGHGTNLNYGALSGLDVNLANFNSVSIDLANNQLTVGAGAKIGDIIAPLYNVGKVVPHGNSVCVGMIGATIGAGIGIGTGLYGLGIDSLESVRLVTATGEVVTASKRHNSELFWAVRGAGANFGIITAATFNMHDQVNDGNAVVASFTYPASANVSVFEHLESFDDSLPADLSVQVSISYNHTTNAAHISLGHYYFGTLPNLQPYLDAAAALGPIASTVSTYTQPELYSAIDSTCASGAFISGSTLGLGQIDPPTLQEVFADMVAFYEANPGYLGVSLFQRYSNTVTRQTPSSETVFPWRDIKTFWLHQNVYLDPALEDPSTKLSLSLREKLQTTSGFPTPQIYINYGFGDEGAAGWWSAANLPKLRRLKTTWDPKNLFGKGNPVF